MSGQLHGCLGPRHARYAGPSVIKVGNDVFFAGSGASTCTRPTGLLLATMLWERALRATHQHEPACHLALPQRDTRLAVGGSCCMRPHLDAPVRHGPDNTRQLSCVDASDIVPEGPVLLGAAAESNSKPLPLLVAWPFSAR